MLWTNVQDALGLVLFTSGGTQIQILTMQGCSGDRWFGEDAIVVNGNAHPVPDRRESDGDCVPAGGHRAVGGRVQINPRQRNRDRLGRWLRGNSEAGPFGSASFAGITLTAGGKTTGLRAP